MKKKVYALNLSSHCNQRCKMCSAGDVIPSQKLKNIAAVKDEIRRVAQMGYNVIDFGGSEPTLYPRLFELIRYSKGLRFRVAIFTNGHRLASTAYIKQLKQFKPIAIKISFHSHKEDIFDYITGTPGSYIKTLEAIKNVHTYLSTVRSRIKGLLVNVVINRYNYKDLPEIVQFLSNHEVKHIKLTQLLLLGSVYKNPDLLIDLDKVYPYFRRAVYLLKKLHLDYDFENIPICFLQSEYKRFNPQYGNARGLKLTYCLRCRYTKICSGIPKSQIIARYKNKLLTAKDLFPAGVYESIFNSRDIAFIKKLK